MFMGHGDFILCCLACKQRLAFSAEVIPREVGWMGCSKDFGLLWKRCRRVLCYCPFMGLQAEKVICSSSDK